MKKNIIVMPDFKQDINQPEPDFVKFCKIGWKKWCEKNNCEFFIIDTPIANFDYIVPQMQKMWSMDIIDKNGIEYDQMAIVDHDTIPTKNCKNFFELTNGKFTAVLDNGFGPQLNRLVRLFKDHFYKEDEFVTWDTYFNSGFIIVNKSHSEVFKKTQEFYFKNKNEFAIHNKADDLNDQTILNFELSKSNMGLNLLPRSYNVLAWHAQNFFYDYTDELGRKIDSVVNINDSINIFHLCGDLNFRNQSSHFVINKIWE